MLVVTFVNGFGTQKNGFNRPGLYTASIKKAALQLILAQIYKRDIGRLIIGLLKWPINEMEFILNEITTSALSKWYVIEDSTEYLH